jgi:hypothetical protein
MADEIKREGALVYIPTDPEYVAIYVYDDKEEPILIARLCGPPTLDNPSDTREEIDRLVSFVSNAYAVPTEDVHYSFVSFDNPRKAKPGLDDGSQFLGVGEHD